MFESIPVGVLTPSVLLGITILAVLTGRLVPRRTYDDKMHEAQEWRTEARLKDQQIDELTEQNNILLRDIAPAITGFMDALQRAGRTDR